MADRESGFYWVKDGERWGVARFYCDTGLWLTVGDDAYFVDGDFSEIGERIERKGDE